MSNDEIQERIDRIRLENTLNSLNPKHISAGKKFVSGLKNATISIAKDKGTRLAGDYIDKRLRSKLGLDNSTSKILQEKAQEYENRKKIDQGERYFKEGKYAEKQSKDTKTSTNHKEDPLRGSVEGEGTNKQKTSDTKSRTTTRNDEPIDVEWREVHSENVDSGRAFVTALLEDKHRG